MTKSLLGAVVGVVLTASLAACGNSVATSNASPGVSGIQHGSLTIDGLKRTYSLYKPPSLDPKQPAPLLLVLTGCPGTGDAMADFLHLDSVASAGGFIAVYPNPVPNAQSDPTEPLAGCWNAGACCGEAAASGIDDLGFMGRLLDRLTSDPQIDKSRIFVAGLSNGGILAYLLACRLSERIAAIASIAGALLMDDCRPTRPVSILQMHGTDDSSVPYPGGYGPSGLTFPSSASTIQRWVALDGCTGQPSQTASGITKTSVWVHCGADTMVRFDTVVGGHHTWFGTDIDPVAGEPDSNATVLGFFRNLAPRH